PGVAGRGPHRGRRQHHGAGGAAGSRRRRSSRAAGGRSGRRHRLVVGRRAVIALDPATLAVRQSVPVGSGGAVELHGAAVAGGLVWSYDSQSGALLGVDPGTGSTRQRVALTDGGMEFRAPAAIVAGADVLWVRVRIGSSNTLEQLITRVDARPGDVTGRFPAPPQLEVGEIAVSRAPPGQ